MSNLLHVGIGLIFIFVLILLYLFVEMRTTMRKRMEGTEETRGVYSSTLSAFTFQELTNYMLQQTGKTGRWYLVSIAFQEKLITNQPIPTTIGEVVEKEKIQRIRKCLKTTDLLHVDNEGYLHILLMQPLSEKEVNQLVNQLFIQFLEPIQVDGYYFANKLSVGVVNSRELTSIKDDKLLMSYAVTTVEKAKESPSGIYFYRQYVVNEEMELAKDLKRAIQESEFFLVYQPKVCLKTDTITGVEALLRWKRGGEIISPTTFIPIAEQTGLIVPIGEWVFRQVCKEYPLWSKKGLTVSVNLSVSQFMHTGLVDRFHQIVQEEQMDPSLLIIEVTETVSIYDMNHAIQIIERFKALGLSVAIDDFGVGYSSLTYLSKLPVNSIKLDRDFLRDFHEEPSPKIVRGIINLAHNVGLTVVAEGVETQEQYLTLQELACDEVQGFFISKPYEQEEMDQFISTW